jgi:hypothetical protein
MDGASGARARRKAIEYVADNCGAERGAQLRWIGADPPAEGNHLPQGDRQASIQRCGLEGACTPASSKRDKVQTQGLRMLAHMRRIDLVNR